MEAEMIAVMVGSDMTDEQLDHLLDTVDLSGYFEENKDITKNWIRYELRQYGSIALYIKVPEMRYTDWNEPQEDHYASGCDRVIGLLSFLGGNYMDEEEDEAWLIE